MADTIVPYATQSRQSASSCCTVKACDSFSQVTLKADSSAKPGTKDERSTWEAVHLGAGAGISDVGHLALEGSHTPTGKALCGSLYSSHQSRRNAGVGCAARRVLRGRNGLIGLHFG